MIKLYEAIEINTARGDRFKALSVAQVSLSSGEINFTFAVTPYGGLWYKGDWVTDKYWCFISEKSCETEYPKAWQQILDQLGMIKAWQRENITEDKVL